MPLSMLSYACHCVLLLLCKLHIIPPSFSVKLFYVAKDAALLGIDANAGRLDREEDNNVNSSHVHASLNMCDSHFRFVLLFSSVRMRHFNGIRVPVLVAKPNTDVCFIEMSRSLKLIC